MTALTELQARAGIHIFEQSGYTSLCCAKSADGRNPCCREREDACHERSFPIYRISVEWVENGERAGSDPDSWRVRDIPDGRVRNHTGFDVMRRERDDEGEPARTAEWFATYRTKKEGVGAWSDVKLESKFIGEETWVLSWFWHSRIDIGESDQEVLASFRRYVERRRQQNAEAYDKWDGVGYFTEPYCLMGAEDEWRWISRGEGTGIIGTGQTTGPAPCRCEGCRVNGVVRIDH